MLIYFFTGRWWSVPGRWQSCFGRAYRRWHGKRGIFHQGALNIIFIGYGNVCRHGFKTWKSWPNFFKFQSMFTQSVLPWVQEVFFPASGWMLRCRSQADSWPKRQTAHEKSVAPRVCPSLPSVAKDDRKQFLFLNLVLNNKTRPFFKKSIWRENTMDHKTFLGNCPPTPPLRQH